MQRSLLAILQRGFHALFKAEVSGVRCASLLGRQEVLLGQGYVEGAQALRIELSLRWPLLGVNPAAGAQMEIVDQAGATLVPAPDLTVIEDGAWRTTSLCLRIPGRSLAGAGDFRVRILSQPLGWVLAEIPFRQVKPDQLGKGVSVQHFSINAGAQPILSTGTLLATEASLHFRLQLRISTQVEEVVEFVQGAMEASLFRDGQSVDAIRTWQNPASMVKGQMAWNQTMGAPAQLCPGRSGEYALVIRVAGCPVAMLRFRLLSPAEHEALRRARIQEKTGQILQSVRLVDCGLKAQRGQREIAVEALWETDQALLLRLNLEAGGFDAEVPAVTGEICLSLRGAGLAQRAWRTPVTLRAGANEVEYHLPLQSPDLRLSPGDYRLDVACQDRVLRESGLRVLSRAEAERQTREAILRNLKAKVEGLEVVAGGRRISSPLVSAESDFILPRFRLEAVGFNELVPALDVCLALGRVGPRGLEQPLAQLLVRLTPVPICLPNLAVRVQGGRLGAQPGPQALILRLPDRELARCPFEIASRERMLQEVQVCLGIRAETLDGRVAVDPKELLISTHRRFAPRLGLRAGVLSPGTLVQGAVRMAVGERLLAEAPFALALDQPDQTREFDYLELQDFLQPGRAEPPEVTITVVLNGLVRHKHTLRILQLRAGAEMTIEDPGALGEYEAALGRNALQALGIRVR